jgi:uncharacterized protein HemX
MSQKPYRDTTNGDLKYAVFTEDIAITFTAVGLSDYTGTVLTVDGLNYNMSNLPLQFSWNTGTVHSFNFSSSITSSTDETYVWDSTSGLSTAQSGSLTVSKLGMVQATYQLQPTVTETPPENTPDTNDTTGDTPTPTNTEEPNQPTETNMLYIYAATIAVAVVAAAVVAFMALRMRTMSKRLSQQQTPPPPNET